jgi:hypothetical protein
MLHARPCKNALFRCTFDCSESYTAGRCEHLRRELCRLHVVLHVISAWEVSEIAPGAHSIDFQTFKLLIDRDCDQPGFGESATATACACTLSCAPTCQIARVRTRFQLDIDLADAKVGCLKQRMRATSLLMQLLPQHASFFLLRQRSNVRTLSLSISPLPEPTGTSRR